MMDRSNVQKACTV